MTIISLAFSFFNPTLVLAENNEIVELQAKLKMALELVASLEAQIKNLSDSNIKDKVIENKEVMTCVSINSTLVRGKTDKETGGEVSKLQEFLKSTGDYTGTTATGYFGPITEKAVQSWQKKNTIVSGGEPQTTGYGVVGPQTRNAIMKKCVVTSPITTSVYNFKSTPERGKAPLMVSFSAKSARNKFADSYYVDFGDGAEGNMVGIEGLCAPGYEDSPRCTFGYNLNAFHTYTTTGKYQATLNEKYLCTGSTGASCIALYSSVVAKVEVVVE